MNGIGTHPKTPEYHPARNRPRSFVVITRLIVTGIAIYSMTALIACQGGGSSVSSNIIQTTETPAQTTTTATVAIIDTGTGNVFTIEWPKPSGTSLPYLTFYNDVKYTNDWLWVKQESPDTVRIGFTDYAQLAVGNFWSINLDGPGTVLTRGTTFGFVQGEDTMDVNLTTPVSGTILEINQNVLADYYLINQSPYDAGWLVLVRISNPDDLNLLLTAAQYASQCCPPCHCNN